MISRAVLNVARGTEIAIIPATALPETMRLFAIRLQIQKTVQIGRGILFQPIDGAPGNSSTFNNTVTMELGGLTSADMRRTSPVFQQLTPYLLPKRLFFRENV